MAKTIIFNSFRVVSWFLDGSLQVTCETLINLAATIQDTLYLI